MPPNKKETEQLNRKILLEQVGNRTFSNSATNLKPTNLFVKEDEAKNEKSSSIDADDPEVVALKSKEQVDAMDDLLLEKD